jgi:gentisate 1,2-dioxygenase
MIGWEEDFILQPEVNNHDHSHPDDSKDIKGELK